MSIATVSLTLMLPENLLTIFLDKVAYLVGYLRRR